MSVLGNGMGQGMWLLHARSFNSSDDGLTDQDHLVCSHPRKPTTPNLTQPHQAVEAVHVRKQAVQAFLHLRAADTRDRGAWRLAAGCVLMSMLRSWGWGGLVGGFLPFVW